MKFDGKGFAKKIEERVTELVRQSEKKPKILSVLVGDDPASVLYTNLKKAAAGRTGIGFEVLNIPAEQASESEVYKKVKEAAERSDITGIMVQLPIPGLSREEQERIVGAIPNAKDVDGLVWEQSGVMPATVSAILLVMEEVGALNGQKVAVIGSAGAIGRPLVMELQHKGIEVILVERSTTDPTQLIKQADVVISCVGKPGLVTPEKIKEGAIVIDVGMSETEEGKVVGDMTKEVYQKASVSVEVPGGVGPVTIASLMMNGINCDERD